MQTRLLYAGANRLTVAPPRDARPARGQRDARAGRGAGPDGARNRDGRTRGSAEDGPGRTAHRQRHADRSREAGSRFSTATWSAACAPAPQRFGWERRVATPGQVRDGRWLVGMGMASAFRGNLTMKSAARTAHRRARQGHRLDRHDGHRYRQLHRHRADRGRDAGRAAVAGRGAAGRLGFSGVRRVRAASGAATVRRRASTRPA